MPQEKVSYNKNWQQDYAEMVVTAAEAVSHIIPGERVFLGTGCATPLELIKALVARSRDLTDIEIVQLLTRGDAPYATKELSNCFPVNSFFISRNVREIIQEGFGDYTPIFLSDIPRLFKSGQLPLDVALIHTTPPMKTACAVSAFQWILLKAPPRMRTRLSPRSIHRCRAPWVIP